ncbi:OmpA family protein [Allochromatium tepidum]|uniref:OmpA/MotB domain-containing protein n=1 Tax=Allochromatium tepidum TaxID=553982 RepID=A0ABM7QM63_9GAMM|nr:OmpA family protein [Allochromatium tepidum]BCU06852.1 OmpA/MotB domain-containing protein [Allochromatium tepidum]
MPGLTPGADGRRLFEPIARLTVVLLLMGFMGMAGAVAATDFERDLAGATDIPGLPRFEGSVIIGHRVSPFDETLIPTGPWETGTGDWKQTIKASGRRTRLVYLAPRNASSLEVIRNYRRALEALGYETLYQCSGFEECGAGVDRFYGEAANGKQLTDSHLLKHVYSDTTVQEPRLYSARRQTPDGDSQLFVFAALQDNFADSAAGNRVAIFVEEVLSQPMRERMVSIEAKEMAQGLSDAGRIAVHGIQFDFNQATIKAESKPQLEQIALMLVENPDLKLYIVGHTDNRGTLDYNMDLSRRRAEEVVRTLIQSYGIPGERLKPMGVANLAPLTSNATEEGRALNRRVEIVAQ